MNGSYNNYTLSPKQAQSLINDIDKNAASCKVKLENNANEFLHGIGLIWADFNAVDFAKKIVSKVDLLIYILEYESNNIKNRIYELCGEYAAAGNVKNTVNLTISHFTSAVNDKFVKETFDGDRYGFADNGSVGQIYSLLEELKRDLRKCGEEFASLMRSTNAFGNQEVKNSLIVFAGKFNSNILKDVNELTNLAKESVERSKEGYARISGGTNANGHFTNSPKNISKKDYPQPMVMTITTTTNDEYNPQEERRTVAAASLYSDTVGYKYDPPLQTTTTTTTTTTGPNGEVSSKETTTSTASIFRGE